MSIIRFRNGYQRKSINMTLGDEVSISWYGRKSKQPNCRFIKVTRKGFNVVDLNTNRCIFKTHLYCKSMVGKEYSTIGSFTGKFWIPLGMDIIKKQQEKVS